jgi:phosphoenolpyruvate synthase/pyruvate phosphate dikinase
VIVWLDGPGEVADRTRVAGVREIGSRAVALSRLRAHGVPVPHGFVLGRTLFTEFTATLHRGTQSQKSPPKLSPPVLKEIAKALLSLGGSVAIRRSPLGENQHSGVWQVVSGGRPERETYLHLTDAAEVHEAVRRIWGGGAGGSSPIPVAIVVQRFIQPEVSAVARRDPADDSVLHVQSTLGIGDLLAAGLVVPDRHTVRACDGTVLASSLGRKAQMTVAKSDGGVVRVPVPATSARAIALDNAKLAELAALWRAAESALGQLTQVAMGWSQNHWYVTSVVEAQPNAEDIQLR